MNKSSSRWSQHLAAAALTMVVLSANATELLGGERHAALLPDYLAASEGDSSAMKRAYNGYSAWVEQSPENPLAQVYLGGVLTLKGRDALMPWNKMKHTEKGLDIMAKAVVLLDESSNSNDQQALFTRVDVQSMAGITFTQVPQFFGRFGEGYDLLNSLVESGDLEALPIEKTAHIYFFAGQAAESRDENPHAIELYKAMLARDATGPNADKAKARLLALGASE